MLHMIESSIHIVRYHLLKTRSQNMFEIIW